MTQTRMPTYLPGDIVAEANLATVDIRLQAAPGGYTLIVFKAGSAEQVYDWCGQFTNLHVALREASRTLAAFETYGNVDKIEAHANLLRIERQRITDRVARAKARGLTVASAYGDEIRLIDTELDTIEDLATGRMLAAARAAA